MFYGYNGRILRVDLSSKAVTVEEPDELFYRRYLGGAGFVSYFLVKEVVPRVDPLGPENKLIFAVGPLTGIPVSGSSRSCIGAKSPLSNGYGKSEAGGFWPAEFKHAGYDAIVIEGKAQSPVYLWIKDGEVNIRDASHLWGMLTKETEETIRGELGDKGIRLASIGPGGENMVRFACIMSGLKSAAGRGGMGAVMGSKNLKAIAVRGTKPPQVAQPERFKEFRKWVLEDEPRWRSLHEFGNGPAPQMVGGIPSGNVPIHNFRDGEFPEMSQITADAIKDTIRIGMEGCFGCVVRCKKLVKVDEPYTVDPAYGGPEYETLAALGSNCGVSDLKALAKANEICNANSLDTISAGVTISFAMECFENGLLTKKDTDGIELKFGNAEAMLKVLELIVKREGIGALLAEGSKRAAAKIGKGAERFAIQVKGVEAAMHDPRAKAGIGLGYAVNPHGADHGVNLHDTMVAFEPFLNSMKPLGILETLPVDDLSPSKVSIFKHQMLLNRLLADTLSICHFLPFGPDRYAEMMRAVTGWNTGVVELLKASERVLTLARVFNMREGFTAADDNLPERFFHPHATGPASKKEPFDRQKFEKAKGNFYNSMGWDRKTGIPTQEKLEELDISWAGV